jgi:hypothetical protein
LTTVSSPKGIGFESTRGSSDFSPKICAISSGALAPENARLAVTISYKITPSEKRSERESDIYLHYVYMSRQRKPGPASSTGRAFGGTRSSGKLHQE